MIKVLSHQSQYEPVVVCDSCGLMIRDHKQATGSHRWASAPRPQSECDQQKMAEVGDRGLWVPMRNHLRFLCANLSLAPKDLVEDELDLFG
jgi:hypothetical protein